MSEQQPTHQCSYIEDGEPCQDEDTTPVFFGGGIVYFCAQHAAMLLQAFVEAEEGQQESGEHS